MALQMRKSILIKVKRALNKLGIELRRSLIPCEFAESITNLFFEIENTDGKKYLVRINGRLWPPFTRQDERFNIKQLFTNNIKTNVIYSDPDDLFQICDFWNQEQASSHANYLGKISEKIRLIHDKCKFKGQYPLVNTVKGSYQQFDKKTQEQYQKYYLFILSLIKIIASDRDNFASSHNDLLPSSVYIMFGQIHFVDFEYSGSNHRTYDLALFSIKLNLAPKEEARLIDSYDPLEEFGIRHSYHIMKPIVSFLLFCWSKAKNQSALDQSVLSLLSIHAVNVAVFTARLNRSFNYSLIENGYDMDNKQVR